MAGYTASPEAVLELARATVAAYRRLSRDEGPIRSVVDEAGRWGVLRDINNEAQTVPSLARARNVSRQHIQKVVDTLVEDGLATLVENPSHKRSKLVTATKAGARRAAKEAKAMENACLEDASSFTNSELAIAVSVLKRLAADGALEDQSAAA